MRLKYNHIILFLSAILAFTSCALLKPKCPIPNCNIAQEHQHNLIFDRKAMKESEKMRKNHVKEFNKGQDGIAEDETLDSDSTSMGAEGIVSVEEENTSDVQEEDESVPEKKKRKKKGKKNEALEDGSDSEAINGDSEETGKKKRKKSKRKNEQEELDEDTQEAMNAGNDTSAVDFNKAHNELSKKEIKAIEKETETELTESEKEAQRIENQLKKNWRSRITAWFKKNQSPKIGEHWKGPVKKGNIPDFRVWPKVRVWPFNKEKDYTSY